MSPNWILGKVADVDLFTDTFVDGLFTPFTVCINSYTVLLHHGLSLGSKLIELSAFFINFSLILFDLVESFSEIRIPVIIPILYPESLIG